MEQDNFYEIFHILSRVIIVISILTLVVGLIMRFSQTVPKIQSSVMIQKPTSIIPMKQSDSVKISSSAAALNLKGPFVCDFSSPEVKINAYVKDNNAYGQIKEQSKVSFILLKDDCVYFWNTTSFKGKKLCGLSPYISMIGQLPLANLLGNSQITSLLGSLGKNQAALPINMEKIPSILNSCKKEEIKDKRLFSLPANVLFNF